MLIALTGFGVSCRYRLLCPDLGRIETMIETRMDGVGSGYYLRQAVKESG
jgi:hypothetical protein